MAVRLTKHLFALLGVAVIALAIISYITDIDALSLIETIQAMFSTSFIALFLPLVCMSAYSITKLLKEVDLATKRYWCEVAHQLANGISTLALTYTLLGISLGIGALSHQSLGPDTVDTVISELTGQFSMAFMTTVVGLPTSTLIRSLASVFLAKYIAQQGESETQIVSEQTASLQKSTRDCTAHTSDYIDAHTSA